MSRRVIVRSALCIAGAIAVLQVATGCAGSGGAASSGTIGMPHRTLVLPPPKLAAHWDVAPYEDAWDWGWQNYRNDDALGIGGSDGLVQAHHLEVRDFDRRSTNNGRVSESSRTTTRSIRHGWLLTP